MAPYSLRALRVPTVSTPVTWDEVESRDDLFFSPGDVLDRVESLGDLFAPVLSCHTPLPDSVVC